MKINLVMIVKNEERSLKRCLESAKDLTDQMIVVDTGSADNTKHIAKDMGAQLYDFSWNGDFSAARNFSLERSDGDWNLVLDADEYLRPCSRKELEQAIRKQGEKGGWMGLLVRYDAYRDQGEERVSTVVIPRLLPRGAGYEGKIHEQPGSGLACHMLPLEAEHDGYLYADKGERNLPYLYEAVKEHPKDAYYHYQLAVTLRNLGRKKESLSSFRCFYRLAGGKGPYRRDGVILYLYTLLDLADKICLDEADRLIKAEEARYCDVPDFYFAAGLFYMKRVLSDVRSFGSLLPKIEESWLKCLAIGERPDLGGVVGTGSYLAFYNLGTWYEVSGQKEKALMCYEKALEAGYEPSACRIRELVKQ